MAGREPLLKLEQVKKYYSTRNGWLRKKSHVKAVDGISLDINPGETLGVVGESGCGKSTLGRTILQLEPITSGKIIFEGKEISSLSKKSLQPYRRKMQMIFQDPYASLDPRQTIGSAIEEPFLIHNVGLSPTERKERVLELLQEVGLGKNYVDRLPHELSGGQRQRIGIARALALRPSFLVCDEPVSALDVSVQAQVLKLLRSLQEKHHLTYFFISHDMGVVRYLSDRVLIMYLGQAMELAPSQTLFKNAQHPYTQALLSAIPRPNPNRKRERIFLKGDLPSPANPPAGCPFHTRCPVAKAVCKEKKPTWKPIDSNHWIACHLYE